MICSIKREEFERLRLHEMQGPDVCISRGLGHITSGVGLGVGVGSGSCSESYESIGLEVASLNLKLRLTHWPGGARRWPDRYHAVVGSERTDAGDSVRSQFESLH